MKRLLLALSAALLLMSSAGCAYIWPSPPSSDGGRHASDGGDPDREAFSGKWCYQRLDEDMRDCYAAVYAAVLEGFARDERVTISDSKAGTEREYLGLKVTLPVPLRSREQAQTLYTAFTWDNPQFFYVGNTYSYEGYRSGNADYYTTFCLVFTMNAQVRREASAALEAVIGEFLAGIPENTDEFGRELYLHDRLIDRCSYDTVASKSKEPAAEYPNAFSVYGALVERKAVCEGYSRSMQLLLQRVGMECTLVSGFDRKNKVAHMWNLVTVDGRNYHLDPTWNDSEDRLRHTYFNLTTEEMERTHSLDKENIGVDTCTAQEANYYRRTDAYLTYNDEASLSAFLAEKIKAGQTTIDMRFSDEVYANALFYFRKTAWLKQTVGEQLAGTGLSMWDYTYDHADDYGTITVYQKTGSAAR